jgi:galactokinase
MKTKTEHIERRFQRHVTAMDGALPVLEHRIEDLPRLQVSELQNRLHQVEVMEQAIRRNIHEVLESGDVPVAERVRKLKSLARLIEAETETLRHESDFMAMGYNNSLEAIAKGTDNLVKSARELLQALGALRHKS